MGEDGAYRTDRRSLLRASAAAAGSAVGLSGCLTTQHAFSGGQEPSQGGYSLETEQTDELQLSNGTFFHRYANLVADDDHLVGIYVDKWSDDRLEVGYELKRLGSEAIETVDEASEYLETGDASAPADVFDMLDTGPELELALIERDNDLIGPDDFDAYFIPAGDEQFTRAYVQQT